MISARGDFTTDDHTHAIVQETLGELERIVGGGSTRGTDSILHAERQIYRREGFTSDILDFALQEGIERIGGLKATYGQVVVGDVHARGEQSHCGFATLLGGHRSQLILDGQIFWGFDDKL